MQKAKFQVIEFKSDTALLTFSFCRLLPSSFAFLASFLSFAGKLVGFSLVGEVFGKAFRILDERKSHWVQNFHGNFQVNVSWFFAFFVVLLDWVTLILVFLKKISSACIR